MYSYICILLRHLKVDFYNNVKTKCLPDAIHIEHAAWYFFIFNFFGIPKSQVFDVRRTSGITIPNHPIKLSICKIWYHTEEENYKRITNLYQDKNFVS